MNKRKLVFYKGQWGYFTARIRDPRTGVVRYAKAYGKKAFFIPVNR